MDVYAIDATSVNAVDADDAFDQIPEVSFEAGREFDLNFFDNADDSNTLGGYSDPGSVESTSIGSPPPLKSFANGAAVALDTTSFQLSQTPSLNHHHKCGMCAWVKAHFDRIFPPP